MARLIDTEKLRQDGLRLARYLGLERRRGREERDKRVQTVHRGQTPSEDRRAEKYAGMEHGDGGRREAWHRGHQPSGTDSRTRQYAEIERGRES